MSRVFVAGSINMDVVATAERHPRPGETVAGRELSFIEGGKGANQAVAAGRAGAETLMVGRIGDDQFGRRLEAFLREEGIDLEYVSVESETASGTALITVAGGESSIVVVPGANGALAPGDVEALPLRAGDVLLCQFETPLETVEAALRRARDQGATTILNPAPALECPPELLDLADVLVVNETELAFFAGTAQELRSRDSQRVVVTLGKAGALALDGQEEVRVEGRPVEAVDATGAGDCFTGYLAAGLSREEPLAGALETANVAASLCVQRFGAGVSMPRAEEVRAAV